VGESRKPENDVLAKDALLLNTLHSRGAVPNCRGNTSHGTKLPAAPHDLWRFLKAPAPLRAQGSAMAPVTPSPGPFSLSAPALQPGRHFSFQGNTCPRNNAMED